MLELWVAHLHAFATFCFLCQSLPVLHCWVVPCSQYSIDTFYTNYALQMLSLPLRHLRFGVIWKIFLASLIVPCVHPQLFR